MAFPVVESSASTNRTAAETTSPISYPATVSPKALLVCIARATVAGAIGWPAGWNELVDFNADASDDVTAIAWKEAVGNEDGTTFNVTHGSGKMAAIVYSITGAATTGRPPQLSTFNIGTSTLPDPQDLTPTGGAKDYLWLWLGGWEGEQTSPPASNPLNYTTPLGANTGKGGVVATNCRVASAQRNLNAASENPGSWTISVSDDWSAWTMAVHPATIAYKDISTRFKLVVQNFKDISTRFRLWVQGYNDSSTRFLLSVQNYKDIATRFKVTAQNYKDVATRFKLTTATTAYKDISSRFLLWVQGYADIATRFLLTVPGYADTASRFLLQVQGYKDADTRFRLWGRGYHDTATRFKLEVAGGAENLHDGRIASKLMSVGAI
ncbi:MAG: hypothetical protein Q8O55_01505 [Dehalococcoidales bacterium]|nr:hypothetical protein [Dehalococcoidales bacterium]